MLSKCLFDPPNEICLRKLSSHQILINTSKIKLLNNYACHVDVIFKKVQTRSFLSQRPTSEPIPEIKLQHQPNTDNLETEIANHIQPYFQLQTPCVFKDLNSKSDAFFCWKSLDYLRMAVGEDTPCHVEFGGPYNATSKEKNGNNLLQISFGDYIDYMTLFQQQKNDKSDHTYDAVTETQNIHKNEESSPLLYLAQNDLFPGLMNDFSIPEFCQDHSYNVGNDGRLYSTMIWFGPKGVTSPLHHDPLDNLLMQFVGTKRILLFPPTVDGNDNYYYSGPVHGQQTNTSAIPSHMIDKNMVSSEFSMFRNAPPALECLLNPGDVLYIPSKWWHYVKSIDTSLSVNVWFR